MAKLTEKRVHELLLADEFELAARLGRQIIKPLERIVSGDNLLLTAKAITLASLVDDERFFQMFEAVSRSRKRFLRVSIAAAAANLQPPRAEPILVRLLKSRDVGVRKCAIRSAAHVATPKLRKQLEEIKKRDDEKELRGLAREMLDKLPPA